MEQSDDRVVSILAAQKKKRRKRDEESAEAQRIVLADAQARELNRIMQISAMRVLTAQKPSESKEGFVVEGRSLGQPYEPNYVRRVIQSGGVIPTHPPLGQSTRYLPKSDSPRAAA